MMDAALSVLHTNSYNLYEFFVFEQTLQRIGVKVWLVGQIWPAGSFNSVLEAINNQ